MTEQYHMTSHKGTYMKKFEAKVEATFPGIVELNKTAFYPLGGGQPSDFGTLNWDEGESKVTDVRKKNRIRHIVEGDIRPSILATVFLQFHPRAYSQHIY